MPKKKTTKKTTTKTETAVDKALREIEETKVNQSGLEAKVRAEAEARDEAAANPVVVKEVSVPAKARKEAWEKHVERYKKANPVKYAQKEKRGEFKEIPDSFTGRNELEVYDI